MLVGYMRVSSDSDRQSTDLQRDALLVAGIDARHLFEDHASGAKDDRPGLAKALEFVCPGDVLVVWKLAFCFSQSNEHSAHLHLRYFGRNCYDRFFMGRSVRFRRTRSSWKR